MTNPLLNNLVASVSQSATIGGHVVTANISVNPGAQIPTTGTNRVSTPSGSLTNCTSEDSSVTPFKASVHYVVIVDGVTAVDLPIGINLGTMLTRSVYAPAPAAG